MVDTLLQCLLYLGISVQYLFWIICIVIDKLWFIINIIDIIMFVLNYVCQNIFLSDYCDVMLVTIKNDEKLP